jgi:uncharacterized protein DUF3157
MKFEAMRKLIFVVLLVFTAIWANAQTEATTNDGQKVVLNDDGTWQFAIEEVTSFECEDLILVETDKMTATSIISAKKRVNVYNANESNGFGIFVYLDKREIVFSIKVKGASECIQTDSKILVLFRNGKRMELKNQGDANCNANFFLYFEGSHGQKKELKMFADKEVESFRIWTAKSYVEQDFTPNQSKQFMKTVECLMDLL